MPILKIKKNIQYKTFSDFKLKSLSFSDYKCFRNNTTIHFAPLTLVFGYNSSGKSTLISASKLLGAGLNSDGRRVYTIPLEEYAGKFTGSLTFDATSKLCDLSMTIKNFVLQGEFTGPMSVLMIIEFADTLTNKNHTIFCVRDFSFIVDKSESALSELKEADLDWFIPALLAGNRDKIINKLGRKKFKESGSTKFNFKNTWSMYGAYGLTAALRDLGKPNRIRKIKLKTQSKVYREMHLFNSDRGLGTNMILKDDSDFTLISSIIHRSLWNHVYPEHLGPLRERPLEGWKVIPKEDANKSIINSIRNKPAISYLSGSGERFWPLVGHLIEEAQKFKKESQDKKSMVISVNPEDPEDVLIGHEGILLREINNYLLYLGTHTALTTPENAIETWDAEKMLWTDYVDSKQFDEEHLRNAFEALPLPFFFYDLIVKTLKETEIIYKGHLGLTIWNGLEPEIRRKREILPKTESRVLPNSLDFKWRAAVYDNLIITLLLQQGEFQRHVSRLNMSDVGSGVSQILPILMNLALARLRMGESSRKRFSPQEHVLITEQPELHLHPKAQADIADLFIRSLTAERGIDSDDHIEDLKDIKHIIETHSETLMLRIKKRVAEQILEPSMVAINYVWQDENGYSYVKHIRLDEKGDFIDSWPDGFFLESFNETIRD